MAKLGINTGIIPNDGTGDHLLAGAVKINSNFNEIYTRFGDGSNLTSIGGTWASTSVGIHTFKKVGIGTTNPTSILTVAGDIKVTGIITASNFVGSGVGLTGLTGIAGTWAVTSIGIHTLKKVGIGTTNPRFALEVGAVGTSGTTLFVNGDARITGIVTIGPASITLNGSTNIINVGTGITIDGSTGIISATSIVLGGSIISGAGVTSIVAGSGITISQSTGNVTITASGSGIGLSISDTPPANTTAYPLWYSSLLGRSFVYYNDGNSSQWVDFSPTSSGGSVVSGGSTSQWNTTAAGIHTLSNVGIGTTNPTSALTVKGNTSLETLNVSGISTFGGLSKFLGISSTRDLIVYGSGNESGSISTAAFLSRTNYLDFGPAIPYTTAPTSFSLRLGSDRAPSTLGPYDILSAGWSSIGGGGFVSLNNWNGTSAISINNERLSISHLGYTIFGGTVPIGTLPIQVQGGLYISGNVGLGITNPTSKLTVSGNVLVSGIASVGTGITMYGSTGIISATTFYGNVVGNISGSITDATNLTGGYANASQLNVSGVTTISQGRIQADGSSNLRFGNIAAGSGSGRNIAIGDQVLYSLSSGQGRNIGIGELSYYDTTSGQYNIGLGIQAGQKITTGNYNVILGGYDGQTGLDIRTSSNNVVIADGQGNIRQYINSSGNVGIKTTVITEALTVSGIVSATSFYGTLNAGQLTGSLPAINGSALIGVVGSGSGVIIQGNGTPVGTAGTINFGSNINVTFASGIATVSGASSVSAATTAYGLAGIPNLNVGVVTATRLNISNDLLVLPRGNSKGIHFGTPPYDDADNDTIIFVSDGATNSGELVLNSGNYNTKIIAPNLLVRNNNTDQCSIGGSISSFILSSVGIGTTNATSRLTVSGDVLVSGAVTASSFSGSGSGLTNIPAAQLTGTLPAIDGSALLNVTAAGTGIAVRDDNASVGSATTVNFGTGLDVTFSSGIATITASGGSLQSRTTVSGVTTSIANLGIGNTNITGFKSYALMKVGLSTTGWLRLYTDSTSRANDAFRSVGEDPAPGSGVIAEVVTTGISTTQIISPFVMGGNLDNSPTTTIYAAIKNLSGTTQSITANLTILQLEA